MMSVVSAVLCLYTEDVVGAPKIVLCLGLDTQVAGSQPARRAKPETSLARG